MNEALETPIQIVQNFLIFLETDKGYADNTIAAYRNDLTQFVTYADEQVKGNWTNSNKIFINDYLNSLKQQEYTSSTIARKIAAIKSFFHYLMAEGLVQNDPTTNLDAPKVKKRLPKTISVDDINRLLSVPARSTDAKSRRDQAMLELLYASGMRVTELVSLNTEDVDFGEATVRVNSKKSGIKERYIPVGEEALHIIEEYATHNRRQLVRTPDDKALFLNHRGQRLTRQGAWLIIKHYVEEIGISGKVTPHTLRHSFAAHKLSRGKSLQDIQKLLGHANISTTQVYAHLAKEAEEQQPVFEIVKAH